MSPTLNGTVLITGAGSGIGRAVTQAFNQAGCKHLVLVDKDASGLSETVKEHQLEESRVTVHALDILNDKAVEEMIKSIHEKLGRLDYAVNCAGITGKSGVISEVTMEDMDVVLNVNLRAQILLNKLQAEVMLKQPRSGRHRGAIVNFSSILGFKSGHIFAAYTISKHAIIGLTKTMATTFGEEGIRTNALAPGYIDTPMTKGVLTEELKQQVMGTIPLRRWGEPEEIAKVALFLCSEDSSYMNGSIVLTDGGILA